MSAQAAYRATCEAEINGADNLQQAARLRDLYARLTVRAVTDRESIAQARMWADLANLAGLRVAAIIDELAS